MASCSEASELGDYADDEQTLVSEESEYPDAHTHSPARKRRKTERQRVNLGSLSSELTYQARDKNVKIHQNTPEDNPRIPSQKRKPKPTSSPSPPTQKPASESSRASNLSAWLHSTGQSLNSVRPPDPIYESKAAPGPIPAIPACLFHPRPPPALRRTTLSLPLRNILRRYNLFAKLVDDYQTWHGRAVFAFWTASEIALATSPLAPAELAAAYSARPSVSPRALGLPFWLALRSAPVLSHLIERYHRDLGYDYFAFFHEDPRVYVSDSERSLRLACLDGD